MRDALTQNGFRVRGKRADCAHCTGRSRLTVSFNDEVAYCHRCHWTANLRQLCGNDPATVAGIDAKRRRLAPYLEKVKRFEAWRDKQIKVISRNLVRMTKQATLAHKILIRFPDEELAWDALARFYHAEAALQAALDWLSSTRVSAWLPYDSTPAEVYDDWRALQRNDEHDRDAAQACDVDRTA